MMPRMFVLGLVLALVAQANALSISFSSQRFFQAETQSETGGNSLQIGRMFESVYAGLEIQALSPSSTGAGILQIRSSSESLLAVGRYYSRTNKYVAPFLVAGVGLSKTIVQTTFYGRSETDSSAVLGRFSLGGGLDFAPNEVLFAILEFRENFFLGEGSEAGPTPSLGLELGFRF